MAPQFLHSDGEVLNLLRAAYGLLLEHICPPGVYRRFLHGAVVADLIRHQGLWSWWAPEHRARSCSIGRLPSLLEELHRALLQGQVCQLQRALPMQHAPGVRDRQHHASRGHWGVAWEPLWVTGQDRAQAVTWDRSQWKLRSSKTRCSMSQWKGSVCSYSRNTLIKEWNKGGVQIFYSWACQQNCCLSWTEKEQAHN